MMSISSFVGPIRPVRPNPVTGGWLSADPKVRLGEINKMIGGGRSNDQEPIDPSKWDKVIQDLRETIEESAEISMLFRSMFEEIPYHNRVDEDGNKYKIADYMQLLDCFNGLLKLSPKFSEDAMAVLPFSMLLELPMCTRAGVGVFLNDKLNIKIGAVLSKWGEFIKSTGSATYLNDGPGGWFSKEALARMQKRDYQNKEFKDLYVCKPEEKDYGFKTWDEFFTRHFKDGVRPVADKDNNGIITSGCESSPYTIKQRVAKDEKYWIKGQPYSLKHILGYAKDAETFVKGTVYQAFLSPLTYHRWNSPINGRITKVRYIKGSYFSVSPIHVFPDPEVFANTESQAYLSAVATRAVFFFQGAGDFANFNMAMIAIGMVEVSTCEIDEKYKNKDKMNYENDEARGIETWTPKVPNDPAFEVKKGDSIGTFHIGGSTHCLIFDPNFDVDFSQKVMPLDEDPDYFIPLNSAVAEISVPKKN